MEKRFKQSQKNRYVLKLFISGATNRSKKAIENIKKICEEKLKGHYELEIIDIFQQPEKTKNENIIAIPTLIKKLPSPVRKFIGDLSDKEKVLIGLEIKKQDK